MTTRRYYAANDNDSHKEAQHSFNCDTLDFKPTQRIISGL